MHHSDVHTRKMLQDVSRQVVLSELLTQSILFTSGIPCCVGDLVSQLRIYVTGQAVEKCTVVENFIWVLA